MRWGSKICMKAGGSRRCRRFVSMGCGILFIPRLDSGDQETGRRWLGSVKVVRRRLGVGLDGPQP
jgi:hypothetical protein